MTTITVPCVAAHLLVTPQPCPRDTNGDGDCGQRMCPNCGSDWTLHRPMVLRFLPTDADTECETCEGSGHIGRDARMCPRCKVSGRRPLKAGDRIAIRALCSNCNGNGSGWPENPITCGGLPCPVCNGVCEECDGAEPEVVGHATVARVLEIYGHGQCPGPPSQGHPAHICVGTPESDPDVKALYVTHMHDIALNITDHVDAGLVFTPGQVALELTDVEATS